MVNKTVITINGLTFGGKAIPLAGFSSTQCIHHAGFRANCKFRARWQGQ